jgi:hypothetical protein
MAADPRVQQLLEEVLESRRSPEDVCRDCPELLPQVLLRLRRLESIQARIGALLPEAETTSGVEAEPAAYRGDYPQHIAGYKVEGVFGHGGMGIVYRALDTRLHRTVALKMLLAGSYVRHGERERFLREVEAAAGLRHPNIVQVYDVGNHDGRPYFTMEFVEGGNLAQQLSGAPLCGDSGVQPRWGTPGFGSSISGQQRAPLGGRDGSAGRGHERPHQCGRIDRIQR